MQYDVVFDVMKLDGNIGVAFECVTLEDIDDGIPTDVAPLITIAKD